jgi:hypothetical protein
VSRLKFKEIDEAIVAKIGQGCTQFEKLSNNQDMEALSMVRPSGPHESSYIRWIWSCPSCGWRTVSLHAQNETREEIEADPLCHRCRKPNMPIFVKPNTKDEVQK